VDERAARALIDERAPNAACALCGGTDWITAKDGKPITFLSFEAKEDPRVRVLAIVCTNCGYLRLHSLDVLEALD
jgi:hypothetical protein